MTTRTDFTQPQAGPQGFARTQKAFGRRVTLTVADLVTGNIVEAFVVPQGFIQTGIIAVSSDLDSSTGVLLSVGDSGSGVRLLSSSTIGQTGATTQTLASTGLLFEYTADTKILVTVTLQPSGTAAAGTLDLYCTGFMK